ITGLAACERYVYAVLQPDRARTPDALSSTLLVMERRDLTLRSAYAFRAGADVHSLCVKDGVLYAVSTGTDEVLELRLRDGRVVAEAPFWRPEPDGPREDVHHLNAVACWSGGLVVTGFGKKSAG